MIAPIDPELNDCVMCGGKPVLWKCDSMDGYGVRCIECNTACMAPTKDEVIDAWNKFEQNIPEDLWEHPKPCPFCGTENPQLLESDTLCWYNCMNCEADGPVGLNTFLAQLHWNSRKGVES